MKNRYRRKDRSMIDRSIEKLVNYALEKGLIEETDRVWALDDAKGLKPDPGQWLIFREPCQENIKVSLKLNFDPAKIGQVEMALISAKS